MSFAAKHITVFEHETIRVNQVVDGCRFENSHLEALQQFFGKQGVPYYQLVHNGVKFSEYVGIIQVGNLTINVLPKADKSCIYTSDSVAKRKWNNMLIGMLNAVGHFDIHAPSSSVLSLNNNSILDLYCELFVSELEQLIHRGLVKKYRKTEGNSNALKGRLIFSRNIQINLVHKEKFYVSHTIYDTKHLFHSILYKALVLVNRINHNPLLQSKINGLMIDFPEMQDVKVTQDTFSRINYDRKTESYRNALKIARLILLNYHPDLVNGNNDVLALMFDMNLLWERFVFVSLKRNKGKDWTVKAQNSTNFWKNESGNSSRIKPDILINQGLESCIVLDTKWKNLNGKSPSPEDLKQMYVYQKYYHTNKVALIYPGSTNSAIKGTYYDEHTGHLNNKQCSIISLEPNDNIYHWQSNIVDVISDWMDM